MHVNFSLAEERLSHAVTELEKALQVLSAAFPAGTSTGALVRSMPTVILFICLGRVHFKQAPEIARVVSSAESAEEKH